MLKKIIFPSLSLVLVLLCFTSSGSYAKDYDRDALYKELKTFTDVLAIIQRDYVDVPDNKNLVEGAIKGMLSAMDPHSGYLDPDFYKDLQVETSGEFGGLGIEITIKDGMLTVVTPMEGSPAERAGVKAGDVIVKIEGKFAKQMTLVEAVKLLRGAKGTPIKISIHRDGIKDLLDVIILRDNIKIKSVRSRYLREGFGYVRISQFMEKTTRDLKKALGKLREEAAASGFKGLILDLRNNPGGLLNQAVGVADLFLRDGVIVYTDGRVDSQKQKFFAHTAGTENDYPVVVLVNGGSASASEIVSGALKDHGRALILGTQTFGKGSVQTIMPLDNGGALRLTTALYYTKSGRSIQAEGVTPDIELEYKSVSEEAEVEGDAKSKSKVHILREKDLPGAIKNQNGSEKVKENRDTSARGYESDLSISNVNPEQLDLNNWLESDNQVARALELLKTFNIFQNEPVRHAGNVG